MQKTESTKGNNNCYSSRYIKIFRNGLALYGYRIADDGGNSFRAVSVLAASRLRKKIRKDFYPRLDDMLKTDTSKENIMDLFETFSQKWDIKFSLAWLLEDFLINRRPKPETEELLKKIVEEEKTLRPFENLPPEEKRIVESITLLLRDKQHDNSGLILSDLQQLATTVNASNAIAKLAEKENKRSLNYAKIGVSLTVLTSVIGILLTLNSIDYDRIKKSDFETDKMILQRLDSIEQRMIENTRP